MTRFLCSLVACVCLSACTSSKETIQRSATYATGEATAVVSALDAATATGDVGPKARPFVDTARERAGNVLGAASAITQALPGVTDVESWYKVLLKRVAVAAVLVVALWLFWPLLPAFVGWLVVKIPRLAFVIPRGIRSLAKFDSEALASAPDSSSHFEATAIRRQASSLYNAAFSIEKARREQNTPQVTMTNT